jgi:ketosteroid isomerase-like protein
MIYVIMEGHSCLNNYILPASLTIISRLNTEVMGDVAVATFLLEVTGMIIDDYSFRGTSVNIKSRVTIVLQKDKKDQWKMVHQHLSKLAS